VSNAGRLKSKPAKATIQ